MELTKEQKEEFEVLARAVISFLNRNCHPMVSVYIDTTSAELSEGCVAFETKDYLRD